MTKRFENESNPAPELVELLKQHGVKDAENLALEILWKILESGHDQLSFAIKYLGGDPNEYYEF